VTDVSPPKKSPRRRIFSPPPFYPAPPRPFTAPREIGVDCSFLTPHHKKCPPETWRRTGSVSFSSKENSPPFQSSCTVRLINAVPDAPTASSEPVGLRIVFSHPPRRACCEQLVNFTRPHAAAVFSSYDVSFFLGSNYGECWKYLLFLLFPPQVLTGPSSPNSF